jgi:hypothetical protein
VREEERGRENHSHPPKKKGTRDIVLRSKRNSEFLSGLTSEGVPLLKPLKDTTASSTVNIAIQQPKECENSLPYKESKIIVLRKPSKLQEDRQKINSET